MEATQGQEDIDTTLIPTCHVKAIFYDLLILWFSFDFVPGFDGVVALPKLALNPWVYVIFSNI